MEKQAYSAVAMDAAAAMLSQVEDPQSLAQELDHSPSIKLTGFTEWTLTFPVRPLEMPA